MKGSTFMLIVILGPLVGGCATAVPVVDFYDTDAEALRRFPAIDILDDAAIASGGYRALGPVQGLYCSRNHTRLMAQDPNAMLQAIDQVKLQAAELGADAVSEPSCVQSHKTDLTNNCWASIVCDSTAWQVDSS